jgi:hypothetical protein
LEFALGAGGPEQLVVGEVLDQGHQGFGIGETAELEELVLVELSRPAAMFVEGILGDGFVELVAVVDELIDVGHDVFSFFFFGGGDGRSSGRSRGYEALVDMRNVADAGSIIFLGRVSGRVLFACARTDDESGEQLQVERAGSSS